MSEYRLTVVRIDDNPNFDMDRAREAARRRQGGYMSYDEPYTETPTKETRLLEVVLSSEEYERVRQGVMEIWK